MGSVPEGRTTEQPETTPPRWTRIPSRAEILQRRMEAAAAPARPKLSDRTVLGAGGDFDPPGATAPTNHARRLFLEAVREVEPDVLAELAGVPFTAFWSDYLRLECGDFATQLMHRARITSWLVPPEDDPPPVLMEQEVPRPAFLEAGRERRVAALLAWADRWRLHGAGEPWCLMWATQTVLEWCERIGVWCYENRGWAEANWDRILAGDFDRDDGPWPFDEWWSPRFGDPIEPSHRIEFPSFDWTPQRERWVDAEARIKADVSRLLEKRRGEIESEMRATDHSGSKTKEDGIEHFRWLALFQVGGWSFGRISRDTYRSDQSVSDGVRKAAASVGLTLRARDRGGRPRHDRSASSTGHESNKKPPVSQ